MALSRCILALVVLLAAVMAATSFHADPKPLLAQRALAQRLTTDVSTAQSDKFSKCLDGFLEVVLPPLGLYARTAYSCVRARLDQVYNLLELYVTFVVDFGQNLPSYVDQCKQNCVELIKDLVSTLVPVILQLWYETARVAAQIYWTAISEFLPCVNPTLGDLWTTIFNELGTLGKCLSAPPA